MDSNQEFKIDEAEERRRAGIPAIVRAVLPRNLWENPLNWKRTKVAMGFAVILITATGATAAVTVGKKATPVEGIQVASIVPIPSQQPAPQVKVSSPQPAAPKSSADANLPPYFRAVDSGQKCGDKKVEVDDPDTVPGHPKLTALLATNPCFNFAFFEQGGRVAVINYIPGNVGSSNVSNPDSKELEEAAKAVRNVMNMRELDSLLNAFTLDMVRKISGPETVEEIKKLTAKYEQEEAKAKSGNRELSQDLKDAIFWNTLKTVASQEGIRVRVSDATREREAADKMPGDFLLHGGTADRYKMILARMSPSGWEKYQMETSFARRENDDKKAVYLGRRAYSHLQDSREIEVARERIKKLYRSEVADQILSS